MENYKKQIRLYLIMVVGICYLLGFIALFTQTSNGNVVFKICQYGFTFFPVSAAVIIRIVTKDKSKWRFSIKVWKNLKLWAFCEFVPSILIILGAVLYYTIFPNEYSGVFDLSQAFAGAPSRTVSNPFTFALVSMVITAAFIPLQLFELGEEVGWREFLLPKQIALHGTRKAILLNGFFWGLAHLPLIYFGFNYSLQNFGAPWSNMAMMMLVCFTTGTVLSFVMVKSNNVMYCAIIHGVIDIIGEWPIFLSLTHKNTLLGPNPTGIIGLAPFIICAVVMFILVGKGKNKLVEEKAETKVPQKV